jgi:hypothetical protein
VIEINSRVLSDQAGYLADLRDAGETFRVETDAAIVEGLNEIWNSRTIRARRESG